MYLTLIMLVISLYINVNRILVGGGILRTIGIERKTTCRCNNDHYLKNAFLRKSFLKDFFPHTGQAPAKPCRQGR